MGYHKNKSGKWKIDQTKAIKLIKAYNLWKSTKPSQRRFLNYTAIRLAKEPTIHYKMAVAFQKKIENNRLHNYSDTSKK